MFWSKWEKLSSLCYKKLCGQSEQSFLPDQVMLQFFGQSEQSFVHVLKCFGRGEQGFVSVQQSFIQSE